MKEQTQKLNVSVKTREETLLIKVSDKNFYITGSKEITEHNWQLIWEAGMIARFVNQVHMNIFLWFCHFVGGFLCT